MSVFMVERSYTQALDDVAADAASEINRINAEEGVRWLSSFLSADRCRTYCLIDATSADAIHNAARRAGLPADVVTELSAQITSDGSLTPL
jgi:hypothetical protein